jgi:uncharacterized protein (TIGR03437 family)
VKIFHLFFLLSAISALSIAAPSYNYTVLDAPGADAGSTSAAAINDSRVVLGGYAITQGCGASNCRVPYGFVYSGGSFTTINFPGSQGTNAYGINNSGQVVGSYQIVSGGTQTQNGFIYSQGSYNALNVPNAVSTAAAGINTAGQVVGGFQPTGSSNSSGFFFDGSTTYTTINYPGATATTLTSINDSGQMAGLFKFGSAVSCFFGTNGSFTPVNTGAYPGYSCSAIAINNAGQLALTLSNPAGSSYLAFIVTSGVFTAISFPGSITTSANGLNNLGDVAGSESSSQGLASQSHGYFATTSTAGTPTISSLSPTSATAGGPAFTLTVNGSNFVSTSKVLWNGTPLTTSFVSAAQLTAAVGANLIAAAGTPSVTVQNPGPVNSNGVTFTINSNANTPVLTSLSPNSALVGGAQFTLTINGSNFQSGATAFWNGGSLTTNFLSNTQLTATVTQNLIAVQGLATVTVQNPGPITSNGLTFTIQSATALSISSLSPNSATAGSGAFVLTVFGANILSGATVLWNGGALATTFVNSGQLNATVGANLIASVGTATITVQNPNSGVISNALNFVISLGSLSVSSLYPVGATAGGPGFTLTVNGTNFLSGAMVLWNGSGLTTTFINSTQLTAAVSASLIASVGTANVTVQNPGGGSASNSVTFNVNSSTTLSLYSTSPSAATAGGAGFTMTVNGAAFANSATVLWNGSPLGTAFVSPAQLYATVPVNLIASPGTVTITVQNPGGVTTNGIPFTINGNGSLSLTSLSPNSATVGGPLFTMTVSGAGFQSGASVLWNGFGLTTTFITSTQLLGTVPASLIAAVGSATITVQNPGGAISNVLTFTINSSVPPGLSSLSPSSAAAGGSALTLTVNGSGFVTGSIVYWNNSALATSYVSTGQLSATVPANFIASQGTASVTVLNPSGGGASNALTFTVTAPQVNAPSITTGSQLPGGTVGSAYSQVIAATGGTTPYTGWAVTAGSLPGGLSLSAGSAAGTELLSGTPAAAGTFQFTLQVTDTAGSTGTAQFNLTIVASTATLAASGIVNSASYAGGSVSPGEIITLFGSFPGPATLVGLQLVGGIVSNNLSGAQVLFDGVAAPMIYAKAGQMAAVVPYEVNGRSATQVQVSYQGQTSNTVSMPVTSVMPGVFSYDSTGRGQGAIINQDGTINSASNPAPAGTVVAVYATGEGQTNPAGTDGKPGVPPAPIPIVQPVGASVAGISASVQYAGGAPGLVAGVLQVNVKIPAGAGSGSVPLLVSIGGQSSQSLITVAVQ